LKKISLALLVQVPKLPTAMLPRPGGALEGSSQERHDAPGCTCMDCSVWDARLHNSALQQCFRDVLTR
jgi:hypothetical protein